MRVRVGSFNVRSFRGGVHEAAASLGEVVPSIVLLQECGPQLRLERFAQAVSGAAVASRQGFGRMRNAIVFGSAWRMVGVPEVHEFQRWGRAIPRGLVAVRLRAKQAELTAVSAHLGLTPDERERHARELVEVLAGLRAPLVLGIDVNEGPDASASRIVAARMVDAFGRAGRGSGATFPAIAPTARIDVVFVRGGAEVADAWVAPAGGSDHLAVVADLEV